MSLFYRVNKTQGLKSLLLSAVLQPVLFVKTYETRKRLSELIMDTVTVTLRQNQTI